VGPFEKSLLRGTRLGFVIAPPWARPVLTAAKRFTDMQSPVHAQDTLAAFISEGHMARHVRKARHVYAKRRQTLLGALQSYFEGLLSPIDSPAGLHVTALTRSVAAARELVRAGIAHRTRVYSLDQFALGAVKQSGVVFGFGAIDAAAIEEGLRHLKRSLDLRRRPRRQRRS
jgi:GntR family transcriptional regulator/MocR family aminotransferase